MFGKGEKKPSSFDSYLPKPEEPLKQGEKTEMAGEHYENTPNPTGEERTFPFINDWGQRIEMREKTIPLTLEVKGEKITKPYTFVFSPGGWDLWREKKKYLVEGLQEALPKVEEEGMPVRVICVLQKSNAPEEERDPRKGKLYYSIVIGLKVINGNLARSLATAGKMEDTFRAWRNRKLMMKDMELAKHLAFAAGYGDVSGLIHIISNCL